MYPGVCVRVRVFYLDRRFTCDVFCFHLRVDALGPWLRSIGPLSRVGICAVQCENGAKTIRKCCQWRITSKFHYLQFVSRLLNWFCLLRLGRRWSFVRGNITQLTGDRASGRDPCQAIRDSIVISKGLVAGMRACRRHVGIFSEDPEFPR
jgi:hypothetical protein